MKRFFTVLTAVLLTTSVFAQTPEKMSYQAVLRDANDDLISNQAVGMQISILQGSTGGTAVYTETQNPTTNANGLVSVEIGAGTTSDDFSLIDWANGPLFIKTETDPSGGTNYSITGTSQLVSVPYALHAKTAENVIGGIFETDPVFGESVAGGITATDTANWNTHTVDTDTQLDSAGVAALGFMAGGIIEADPVFGESIAKGISATDTTNWSNKLSIEIDGSITNEIQDLQLIKNLLMITEKVKPTSIDLSPYLDAAFTTTDNTTSNAPGNYTTDDFVFGSPQMDDDGDENHDYRMFFDKSTGAFRVGNVAGTQWDLVNRGDWSIGLGQSTAASGNYSVALGAGITASGDYSTAMGSSSTASAQHSTAIGRSLTASGINSLAMGVSNTASGSASTAMGLRNKSRSYAETAIGLYNTDYAPNSTTNFDSSDRLFVIGNGTSLIAHSDALIIFKNGDATLAGTLTQLSDVQLKNNINSLDQSLNKLLKLQGVNYHWNEVKPHDTESLQTGLIAQEVEKILPELVNQSSDGYKSVNYIGLIPHLIEALKESDQKIKSLEGRLLKLENLINE